MSATLWVGQKEGDITMMPYSSFIDTLFEQITLAVGESHPQLIEELQDGYVFGTYMNISDLNKNDFIVVKNILINFYNILLNTPITSQHKSELHLTSWLRVGLLLDERVEENIENNLVQLKMFNKEHLFSSWCIEICLSSVIFREESPVDAMTFNFILNYLKNPSEFLDITLIQSVLISKLENLRSRTSLYSQYVKDHYIKFIDDLELFLTE